MTTPASLEVLGLVGDRVGQRIGHVTRIPQEIERATDLRCTGIIRTHTDAIEIVGNVEIFGLNVDHVHLISHIIVSAGDRVAGGHADTGEVFHGKQIRAGLVEIFRHVERLRAGAGNRRRLLDRQSDVRAVRSDRRKEHDCETIVVLQRHPITGFSRAIEIERLDRAHEVHEIQKAKITVHVRNLWC